MNWWKLPRKFGVNPLAPENGQAKKVTSKNRIGNFWDFRVFDFGPYTEIKNSENSEIFTTHVHSKECVLPEEVGNFWDFRVFNFLVLDFGPYTEIKNSENLEILY